MTLAEMNPDSRLWLYPANREMNATEIAWVNEQIAAFVASWAAHGHELKAAGHVIGTNCLALAVDLTHENASGCSIDSSVRFVKDLGKELGIDFFNRLKVWTETPTGELTQIPFSKVNEQENGFIFDFMLTRLGDLESKFKVPFAEFKERYLTVS